MNALDNTSLIIFGVTGDLARRKILPSLYRLYAEGMAPGCMHITGISRRGTSIDDIARMIQTEITVQGGSCEPAVLKRLCADFSIVDMHIADTEQYSSLAQHLDSVEPKTKQPLNRLFYLAIPADLFEIVITRLGEPDFNRYEPGIMESRFLIEKPFGTDLASARELISILDSRFDERQIYRIDHYLAKETAQNILTFRFNNPLFSSCWNNEHISHIMVTASETIGIEGRVAFYEKMGALRDLVQSHLLQLLALVTMDRPSSFSAQDIHREKNRILDCIHPPGASEIQRSVVRGQYTGYRTEVSNQNSQTETYCALKLQIDSEAWQGVPVFIRTGKALRSKVTEITLVFRDPEIPHRKNWLTLRIQPNEGIVIDLEIKKPGYDEDVEKVQLDFCYNDQINAEFPDAYQRVLVDAMRGDQTLFATGDEVLSCWKITEPILEAWRQGLCPMHEYEPGSWGPEAADILAGRFGSEWLTEDHPVCTWRKRRPVRETGS